MAGKRFSVCLILLLFILLAEVFGGRDFYKILGVRRSASRKEIEKAYRGKAKILHPDHSDHGSQGDEKFKELSEAYDVLSDPQKRKIYDKGGEDALKQFWGSDS